MPTPETGRISPLAAGSLAASRPTDATQTFARRQPYVSHTLPGLNLPLTNLGQTAGMKRLILLIFLASCGPSPAPEFFGATQTQVSRNGRDYVVYQKADRVEIIRLGYAKRGEHQAIRADMIALIPEVTGCKLRETSLQGDSGEMRGSLTC